jgi:hypothetical protein
MKNKPWTDEELKELSALVARGGTPSGCGEVQSQHRKLPKSGSRDGGTSKVSHNLLALRSVKRWLGQQSSITRSGGVQEQY